MTININEVTGPDCEGCVQFYKYRQTHISAHKNAHEHFFLYVKITCVSFW